MRLPLAAAASLTLVGTAAAREPILSLPIDCVLGETCYIQNYVDRDPGPGAADFTCSPLSYDGHKGTDFALPSLVAMHAGVDVLAAAPGTVTATRDGMQDIYVSDPDAPSVEGRECGNGVVIDHGGGWQTQYCHMRRGTISVSEGQRVTKGAELGQVGLSGKTEFPHVHLALRHDSQVIDPFLPADRTQCEGGEATSLWQDTPTYRPGGVIAAGFAPGIPEYEAVRAGDAGHDTLDASAGGLVIWGYFFGGRNGDEVQLTIEGPAATIIEHSEILERTQAQLFRAAGRRTPASGWPQGEYQGHVRLLRDGVEIDSGTATVEIVE